MRLLIFFSVYALILFLFYVPLSFPVSYEDDIGFTEVFFCQEINCATLLVDLLIESESAYCALYDLDEPTIITAITEKNTSTLLFEDNYEKNLPKNIKSVESKGLMHHKFCVFDEQYVLTGSWNPTVRGTNVNDNYVLFISSEKIAESFIDEFNYLQTRKDTDKPNELFVNLSGTLITVLFCPLHDCEENVLETLSKANKSIQVLAFSFTSQPIAEILVNKSLQGVNVSVVFEKTRIASYSQYDYLEENNVAVFKDANRYTMHEKVFIIDGKMIIVGSYNPTSAATHKNDENLLILRDERLAEQFLDEFERIQNALKQQN